MSNFVYREATNLDIPCMAKIRAKNSATEEHWSKRIAGYLEYTVNPQQALKPRVIFVAVDDEKIIGFIAGHLTRRYNCDGELEWIDVDEEYRRNGVASTLLLHLAKWFVQHESYKICVDPGNEPARDFYRKNGSVDLNSHWMFWEDIKLIL